MQIRSPNLRARPLNLGNLRNMMPFASCLGLFDSGKEEIYTILKYAYKIFLPIFMLVFSENKLCTRSPHFIRGNSRIINLINYSHPLQLAIF